jgi:hypothetical protein
MSTQGGADSVETTRVFGTGGLGACQEAIRGNGRQLVRRSELELRRDRAPFRHDEQHASPCRRPGNSLLRKSAKLSAGGCHIIRVWLRRRSGRAGR